MSFWSNLNYGHTGFVLSGTHHLPVENYDYELVPNRLNWSAARQVCAQKSGALASVSSETENRQLTKFLQSLKITQPVWIAGKVMTQINGESSVQFPANSFEYHHLFIDVNVSPPT